MSRGLFPEGRGGEGEPERGKKKRKKGEMKELFFLSADPLEGRGRKGAQKRKRSSNP